MQDQVKVLWQTILGEIELEISEAVFKTWFRTTKLISIDDQKLTISVLNFFAKNQFRSKFDPMLKKTFKRHGFPDPKIEYVIESKKAKAHAEKSFEETVVVKDTPTAPSKSKSSLNPRYRFDNFIVGDCNDLAHASAQAVAAMPGEKYNPIFVYGNSGLGKTHLIQAIGNEILRRDPKKNVVYIPTDQFVSEFIDYVRFKKDRDFSKRYRNADVLIVDDIQFIAGKEKNQDEFFHTFNALHQANKQIVISCDRPPIDIPTLTERLKTRFDWGMTVDISLPDFETRCAIVKSKAEQSGIEIDDEVVSFLAEQIQTNVRELEGALNKLLATCEMQNIKPDIELAQGLLENVKNLRPKHITARQILERVASYFEIKVDEMCSPARDKRVIIPRQFAMYLLRSELKLSFPVIARELGRKDHTTAIHSVEKIERSIKLDMAIREQVSELKERIYV